MFAEEDKSSSYKYGHWQHFSRFEPSAIATADYLSSVRDLELKIVPIDDVFNASQEISSEL